MFSQIGAFPPNFLRRLALTRLETEIMSIAGFVKLLVLVVLKLTNTNKDITLMLLVKSQPNFEGF